MANYILISDHLQAGMIRQLLARGDEIERNQKVLDEELRKQGTIVAYRNNTNPARQYAAAIENAPTIRIPELHIFRDTETGDSYQVCGWDREDGLRQLRAEHPNAKNLEWNGSSIAWPGMHTQWLHRTTDAEEYDYEPPAEVQTAIEHLADVSTENIDIEIATLENRIRKLLEAKAQADTNEAPF